MSKKQIEFRDPVVERVVDKFVSRSDVGFAKYGVTLEDDKSNIFAWVNHLQEELMDALLYIEAAKRCLSDEIEEAMINRINVVGQNGNDGLHYYDIEINEQETL